MQTLREAREKKGIKLGAVASAIGVTRQTYYKYEADQGSMSIDKAEKACEFIGVNFDDVFFCGRSKSKKSS